MKKLMDELPDIGYYVFDARAKTAADFRAKNSALVEETLSELNRLYLVVMFCVLHGGDVSKTPRFDAFSLFVRALESLVSSVHLASHRQAMEACVLMRHSLETAATAAHICMSHEALVQYGELKYKSTSAISHAKNIVPIIGEIWGIISTLAVHVNLRHGPFYEPSEDGDGIFGTIEIPLAEKKASPGKDEGILTLISLVSNINLRLFEETLLEKSPTNEGFLQVPGTGHLYLCPTIDLIAKYHDRFIELLGIYQTETRKGSRKTSGEGRTTV